MQLHEEKSHYDNFATANLYKSDHRIIIPAVHVGQHILGATILGLLYNPIRVDLVWFYGISTIVGYLMLNPFLYILKKFEGNKICNIKEFEGIKFDTKEMSQKPNLGFNWVMILGGFNV